MENAIRIIAIWSHILGIALFVGPQFFLAFAWVPASRGIVDFATRRQAMHTITRRFGWIGGIGLVLLLISGLYLIGNWRSYYKIGDDASLMDYRYGMLFMTKMTVVVVMLVVLAAHTFWAGPRLVRALEAQNAGKATEAQVAAARRISVLLSIAGLLLALVIMGFGVSLNNYRFSLKLT